MIEFKAKEVDLILNTLETCKKLQNKNSIPYKVIDILEALTYLLQVKQSNIKEINKVVKMLEELNKIVDEQIKIELNQQTDK